MSCRPVLACKSLVSTFDSTTFSSGLCRKIVAGFGFLSWKFPTWSPSLFGWNDWGTTSHCWCLQYQPSPLLQTCWAPVQRLQFFVASPLQDLFTNSDIVKNKSNRTGKKVKVLRLNSTISLVQPNNHVLLFWAINTFSLKNCLFLQSKS